MGIKPRRIDPDTIFNFLGRRRVKSEDDQIIDRGNIVEVVSSQPKGKPTVRNATPNSTGRLMVAHIPILPGKEGECVEWSQTERDTGDTAVGAYVYLDQGGRFSLAKSPTATRAIGQVLRENYVLLDPNANWSNAQATVAPTAPALDSGQLTATAVVSLANLNEESVEVVGAEKGAIVVESVELRTDIESPFEASQNTGFILRYSGGRREASALLPAKHLVSDNAVGVIRPQSVVAPENTGITIGLKGGKLKGNGEGSLQVTVFYRLF